MKRSVSQQSMNPPESGRRTPDGVTQRPAFLRTLGIERGEGKPEDLDMILKICDSMLGATICALADGAVFPRGRRRRSVSESGSGW